MNQRGPTAGGGITRRHALRAGAAAVALTEAGRAVDARAAQADVNTEGCLPPAACVATSGVPALDGLRAFDGYSMRAGDVVLLTRQPSAAQNGPWVVARGPWTRPPEFTTGSVTGPVTVTILHGETYGGSTWMLESSAPITVGTTPELWVLALQRSVLVASQNPTNARVSCAADGVTDDTAALQALLDAGGEIYLPADSAYQITGVTVPVSGTRVYGAGTIVWVGSSTHGISIPDGVGDVELVGITIDGSRAGPAAGNAVNAHGLRHTFRDLHIHDTPQAGIAIWSDVYAQTTLRSPVAPGTHTLQVASSSGFEVGGSIQLSPGTASAEENTVRALPSATMISLDHPSARSHDRGAAVTQPGTQHILVRDCKVDSAAGDGILVSNVVAADGPVHVSLIGNHIDLPGLAGINASGSHLVIVGNVINAPGAISPHADGITFYDHGNEDVLVANNSVFGSANNGIHGGGNRVHLVGNAISTCWGSSGLFVSSDPNSGPTFSLDAVITGNRVYNVLTSSGIIVYGYANVTLSGNSVDSVYAYGVSVEDNVGNPHARSTDAVAITGNTIRSSQTASGIHLLGVTRASVTGNVITDCQRYGIDAGGTDGLATTDCAVSGNTIDGCREGAVVTSGAAARILVTGNAVRDCGAMPFLNGGAALGLLAIANQSDLSAAVSADPELPVPLGLDVAVVQGSAAISAIAGTSGFLGRTLTLLFSAPCTMRTGANIRLTGDVDQTFPAGSALTLVCDGSGIWHETAGPNLPQYDRDYAQAGMYATPAGLPPNGYLPLVAARLYLLRFVPSRVISVVEARIGVSVAASANDQLDLGVYDGQGARLWHLGPTGGLLNGTGVVACAVSPTLVLNPGSVYYAALLCPAVGGTPASVAATSFGGADGDPGTFLFCAAGSATGASMPSAEGGWLGPLTAMPSSAPVRLAPTAAYPVLALREASA